MNICTKFKNLSLVLVSFSLTKKYNKGLGVNFFRIALYFKILFNVTIMLILRNVVNIASTFIISKHCSSSCRYLPLYTFMQIHALTNRVGPHCKTHVKPQAFQKGGAPPPSRDCDWPFLSNDVNGIGSILHM